MEIKLIEIKKDNMNFFINYFQKHKLEIKLKIMILCGVSIVPLILALVTNSAFFSLLGAGIFITLMTIYLIKRNKQGNNENIS